MTYNNSYRVALLTIEGIITVTIKLDNPSHANAVDSWLADQKDNSIYAADGGPNDIEL